MQRQIIIRLLAEEADELVRWVLMARQYVLDQIAENPTDMMSQMWTLELKSMARILQALANQEIQAEMIHRALGGRV